MFTHLTMACALFGTTGQDRKSCGPSKASWVPRRDRQALSCCQTWLTHNTNRSMTPSGDQSPVPIWGKEAGQQNWICSALMIKHHVAKVKYQKDIWEGISQTGFPVNSSTMFLITSPCATLNDPFPNIWAFLGLQVEKKPKNNNMILVVIKKKTIWPSTKMMQSLWQLQLNLCLTLWSSFLRRCLPSRLCSGSWSQRKVTQRKCCWRRSSAPCRRGFDNVAIRKFPSRKWWGPEGRKDKTKKPIYLASSS